MGGEQAGGTPPPSTESTGRQASAWIVAVLGLVGGAGAGGVALSAVEPLDSVLVSVGAFVLGMFTVLVIVGKISGQEAQVVAALAGGLAAGLGFALVALLPRWVSVGGAIVWGLVAVVALVVAIAGKSSG